MLAVWMILIITVLLRLTIREENVCRGVGGDPELALVHVTRCHVFTLVANIKLNLANVSIFSGTKQKCVIVTVSVMDGRYEAG